MPTDGTTPSAWSRLERRARARWFRPSRGDLRRLRPVLRPLPVVAAATCLLHRLGQEPAGALAADPTEAVLAGLRARGLSARRDDVHFLPRSPRASLAAPLVHDRVLVRARRQREPHDIYLVDFVRSPEGTPLALDAVQNLTETAAADEQRLVVEGPYAAWATANRGIYSTVQLVDVRGETRSSSELTVVMRVQHALTRLQETGQLAGIARRSFRLEPRAFRLTLSFERGELCIQSDGRRIRIPTAGPPTEGAAFVRDQTPPLARPGSLITWTVDRVRAMPWFGDATMQMVKAVAFEGKDQLEQMVSTVTGNDGAAAVAEDLGALYATGVDAGTDPETGWPPAPLEPFLQPPLRGEGKWVTLENDPFVGKNPNAPSPFAFTFLRPDRDRAYSQVYIVLWDPRQVELDAVAGTREPKSQTGETGSGLVPREPRVLSRFVAGFNGGFQTLHGDWGMMANRVEYVSPRAYAGTVAKLADGSTGFGTWPEDTTIPDDLISFRQNMTPLVAGGRFNPYQRHWWGGVPPGWTHESRTVRSALCKTTDGFVAYVYGGSVDHEVLGRAMLRARCDYGIHLDMNYGHTGFEFYRIGRAGTLPELPRKLDPMWEARGPLPDAPEWEFMSRRMIKHMALMNFPRYVSPESRDFFYLTLRPLLPGHPIAPVVRPAEDGEGVFRVHGLPQHGWPPAVATTNLRPDANRPATRAGLIKIDPKFVAVETTRAPEDRVVVEFRSTLRDGPSALWHSERAGFTIGVSAPDAEARPITTGFPEESPGAARAQAVLGVDPDGMLVYARITEGPDPERDRDLLRALLERLGCTARLFLPRPLGASLGEQNAGASESTSTQVVLKRRSGPGIRSLFPTTPVVPPKTWQPLQRKRTHPE